MNYKDIVLHLRLPFSFFLMPVFWFAVSLQENPNIGLNVVIFIILHLLVYPSSNAYNSFHDKDEGPIGGLKAPPRVDKKLLYTANIIDGLSLLFSYIFVGNYFFYCVLAYIVVSRLYSNPSVRIKKYPFLSWLIIGLFQGSLVFYVVYFNGQNYRPHYDLTLILALAFSATLLWAVYPITQIYQHNEDQKANDLTLSRVLGIKGTLIFAGTVFCIGTFIAYFVFSIELFILYSLFNLPLIAYFLWWYFKINKDTNNANFKHTMRFTLLASILLNLFFVIKILW